jgi:murein hydrolase activator
MVFDKKTVGMIARPMKIVAAILGAMTFMSTGTVVTFAEPAAPTAAERRQAGVSELDELLAAASVSDQRAKELTKEIASLKKDETSVTAALIQSAKTERKLSQEIEPIEERLAGYREQEDAIRMSLASRREVLAEVLAGLQRMGLNPPPAILVKPQDALSSVRSAILLGAVVPQLRSETEILLADIESLNKVTISIKVEREQLLAALKVQAEEKLRLDQLVNEKKALRSQSEAALKLEAMRVRELAQKSKSLKELIAGIEKEMAATAKREAEALAKVEQVASAGIQKVNPALPPEPSRIAPTASFAALKGELSLPATGSIQVLYGADDGQGGISQGYTIATKPGGRVTTPADATVLYADTFRSYGNLLILDAGQGYHLVMSGMNRIDVTQNQSVLAGEPVGVMGEQSKKSDGGNAMAQGRPSLYIEFRKDGKPVDSGPWWAGGPMGRTNNDT